MPRSWGRRILSEPSLGPCENLKKFQILSHLFRVGLQLWRPVPGIQVNYVLCLRASRPGVVAKPMMSNTSGN